ncbi:hypothetical protein SLEP1_g15857 [Rubroshorea leprosula]|uniref:Uncharacterized protein n=1 Tax=Rubroshorea leprosula TaxID=152421 RepID=A0AAV5IXY3_9ROSI|nr:hypothetical protein SLEP1_g15857 [Rubroshorea leprosula]
MVHDQPFSTPRLLCLLQQFLCGKPGYAQNMIAPDSKRALAYQIIAILVSNSSSRRLSRHLKFIHRPCGSKVNSIANRICLILAIVLEKFYEKSLGSLGFALSNTVLFLILLVIIRLSTDLGLFGFLIGVIGSVAYDLFVLKFQTWIIVAICFQLLGFRIFRIFFLRKGRLGRSPSATSSYKASDWEAVHSTESTNVL